MQSHLWDVGITSPCLATARRHTAEEAVLFCRCEETIELSDVDTALVCNVTVLYHVCPAGSAGEQMRMSGSNQAAKCVCKGSLTLPKLAV